MASSLRLTASLALFVSYAACFCAIFTCATVQADTKIERPGPQHKIPENLQVMSVPVDISYVKPNGNPSAKIEIPAATLKGKEKGVRTN